MRSLAIKCKTTSLVGRRINPSSLTWEQFLIKTGWDGEKRAFGPSQ